MQEKPDGGCIFLEGNDCAVQSAKPRQCRDFPNLWNFPGFEKFCHAIPREVSAEDYERRIAQIKLTGSMSTAKVTSSGRARVAMIFARAWLNLLIARVRSMIW